MNRLVINKVLALSKPERGHESKFKDRNPNFKIVALSRDGFCLRLTREKYNDEEQEGMKPKSRSAPAKPLTHFCLDIALLLQASAAQQDHTAVLPPFSSN